MTRLPGQAFARGHATMVTLELRRFEDSATRETGNIVRTKVIEAIHKGQIVEIDFGDLTRVTPSFVDELLGKLVLTLGSRGYHEKIRLKGVNPVIATLIDVAVSMRNSAP